MAAVLNEFAIRRKIKSEFLCDIDLVENSLLNGFRKLWLYQFYVLARLSWAFLVQDLVASCAVELDCRDGPEAMSVQSLASCSNLMTTVGSVLRQLTNTTRRCKSSNVRF